MIGNLITSSPPKVLEQQFIDFCYTLKRSKAKREGIGISAFLYAHI